ncbi:hypothetical protein AB0F17_10755 [Nonomuraea sp. NPDC026600]|uniref:hypothetical protein n=1 Tax=Nonomuraea sp. NPDC026600 TaxID=3155363 RepID=UPI003401F7E3
MATTVLASAMAAFSAEAHGFNASGDEFVFVDLRTERGHSYGKFTLLGGGHSASDPTRRSTKAKLWDAEAARSSAWRHIRLRQFQDQPAAPVASIIASAQICPEENG